VFRVAKLDVPHLLQHSETAAWTLANVLRAVNTVYFVGALAYHVCLSVRMEKLGTHWSDFHEI
jgi:hypothetical protein